MRPEAAMTLDLVEQIEAEAVTVLALAELLREHSLPRQRVILGRVAEDLFGAPTSHGALTVRGKARGRRRSGHAGAPRPAEERDEEAVLVALGVDPEVETTTATLIRQTGLSVDTLADTLARLAERGAVVGTVVGWQRVQGASR
jgi:hypothetical protein